MAETQKKCAASVSGLCLARQHIGNAPRGECKMLSPRGVRRALSPRARLKHFVLHTCKHYRNVCRARCRFNVRYTYIAAARQAGLE